MNRINLRRRPPDLIVGRPDNPYLKRWTLVRWRGWQLALHKILRDDDDRALHDHIGDYWAMILWRGYFEVLKHDWEVAAGAWPVGRYRHPFIPYHRNCRAPHRLVLKHPKRPTYTLWLRAPKVREWGFHTEWGWIHNEAYDAFNWMVKALHLNRHSPVTFDVMNAPWIQKCSHCQRFHDLHRGCAESVAPCVRCSHENAYSCRLCVPSPCRCMCHWLPQLGDQITGRLKRQ